MGDHCNQCWSGTSYSPGPGKGLYLGTRRNCLRRDDKAVLQAGLAPLFLLLQAEIRDIKGPPLFTSSMALTPRCMGPYLTAQLAQSLALSIGTNSNGLKFHFDRMGHCQIFCGESPSYHKLQSGTYLKYLIRKEDILFECYGTCNIFFSYGLS